MTGSSNDSAIVVVYSSYRTASTWFWTRLRAHQQLRCYYEVFNEILSTLTHEQAGSWGSGNWRSRHPDIESYWEEYVPMIEASGVRLFPTGQVAGEHLISSAGIRGALDTDVRTYLDLLVEKALSQGKTPVLTGPQMLGHASGIRNAFPGYHILLTRNLFHQWNSYSGQFRTGNSFFLLTLKDALALADKDKVIHRLSEIFSSEYIESNDKWTGPDNSDNLFCFFVSLHVYLYLEALGNVDLVIDSTRLSEEEGSYREEIEDKICRGIGVSIDLSDAQTTIDLPSYPIFDPDYCRNKISNLVDDVHNLRDSPADDRQFSDRMLGSVWEEWRKFDLYSKSARERITEMEIEIRSEIRTDDSPDEAVAALEASLAEAEQKLAREAAVTDALRVQNERQREVSIQRDRDIARVYDQIATLKIDVALANERATHKQAETERFLQDSERNAAHLAEAESRIARALEAERHAMQAADAERQRAKDAEARIFADFAAERADLHEAIASERQRASELAERVSDRDAELEISRASASESLSERDRVQGEAHATGEASRAKAEEQLQTINALVLERDRLILQRDEAVERWEKLTKTLRASEAPRALRWVLPLARWLRPFAGEV